VGSNKHSWGWDLGRGKAYYDTASTHYPAHPTGTPPDKSMTIPDTFLMILDLNLGTLAFMADGRYLGVAHTGLRGRPPLFPIVSAVWGHCEVSLRYRVGVGGGPGPAPLSEWCRRTVRRQVGPARLEAGAVGRLGLPTPIQDFLLHR
jgi:SPRY domain-containing SOCS box protein 1/4